MVLLCLPMCLPISSLVSDLRFLSRLDTALIALCPAAVLRRPLSVFGGSQYVELRSFHSLLSQVLCQVSCLDNSPEALSPKKQWQEWEQNCRMVTEMAVFCLVAWLLSEVLFVEKHM